MRDERSEDAVRREITRILNGYPDVSALDAWTQSDSGFVARTYAVMADGDYDFVYIIVDDRMRDEAGTMIAFSSLMD